MLAKLVGIPIVFAIIGMIYVTLVLSFLITSAAAVWFGRPPLGFAPQRVRARWLAQEAAARATPVPGWVSVLGAVTGGAVGLAVGIASLRAADLAEWFAKAAFFEWFGTSVIALIIEFIFGMPIIGQLFLIGVLLGVLYLLVEVVPEVVRLVGTVAGVIAGLGMTLPLWNARLLARAWTRNSPIVGNWQPSRRAVFAVVIAEALMILVIALLVGGDWAVASGCGLLFAGSTSLWVWLTVPSTTANRLRSLGQRVFFRA